MAWKLTLKELQENTGGEVVSQVQTDFSGTGSDTRNNLEGKIFFALKGEQFDGHFFLIQAVEKGASCLIVHEDVDVKVSRKVTVIKVRDTLRGLQDLANYWRRRNKFKVIGITGSNGKTTTKEFTKKIIEKFKKVHESRGSFNNHWGVPFTLLGAEENSEIVICEMGMNHKGELARLVEIAEPNVVVCLNIGRAHMEFFSSLEEVAQAKEEIYHNSDSIIRVFNLDDPLTLKMMGKFKNTNDQIKTFSQKEMNCDVNLNVKAQGFEPLRIDGRVGGVTGSCEVNVFGLHNGQNLMAASALALSVGLEGEDIWCGLKFCQSYWGRNQVLKKDKTKIIFDGYNANPESMKALFQNLARTSRKERKSLVILGEMLEMGQEREKAHEEVGYLAGKNSDEIWFIGESVVSFNEGLKRANFSGQFRSSKSFLEKWADEYGNCLDKFELVVLKGSRGMKLERILQKWGVSEQLGLKD